MLRQRRRCVEVLVLAVGMSILCQGLASADEPGARLWVSRFKAAPSFTGRNGIAASPDGSQIFVTAFGPGPGGRDFLTNAYDAATGEEIWGSAYGAPGAGGEDRPSGVAVSPSDSVVFVTGGSKGGGTFDYATIAYDTVDGHVIWKERFDEGLYDSATALAVSPDGAYVFVTGASKKRGQRIDYLTVAYDASTGRVTWHRRLNSGDGLDLPSGLAVSPDGSSVVVTGTVHADRMAADFATIAYDSTTGTTLWKKRFDGPQGYSDSAADLVMSPSGEAVFVIGTSQERIAEGIATVGYAMADGEVLWTKLFIGEGEITSPASVAVNPDGSSVYVTGSTFRNTLDYVTIAYGAADGSRAWTKHFDGRMDAIDDAAANAVSPDGSTVYVAGTSENDRGGADYLTVAFDSGTGSKVWAERYGPRDAGAAALIAGPTGSSVFVTGDMWDRKFQSHITTVAYAA